MKSLDLKTFDVTPLSEEESIRMEGGQGPYSLPEHALYDIIQANKNFLKFGGMTGGAFAGAMGGSRT